MATITPAPLTHDEIISRLRGQTLHVPDLTRLFTHWPSASSNPHCQTLRTTVDQAITNISSTRPSSERRKNDDLALLTSLWYPNALPERLKTLALYTVWLVCWDDEVDANEGDLAGDFAKAEAWRSQTLEVAKASLDLADELAASNTGEPLHDILFVVGRDLQTSFTRDQRQHFFNTIAQFIHNCGTEQKLRLQKTIPDYDSYMEMRLGTVGGAMLCSMIEFSHDEPTISPLPLSPARAELDKQVCVLLSLLNDVLSLKKELRTDCVINAVATLMTSENDLASVVADVINKMEMAVRLFDTAAKELKDMSELKSEKRAAQSYVDGCRSIVTGTLEFTLKSPRYRLASLLAEDGSLRVVL